MKHLVISCALLLYFCSVIAQQDDTLGFVAFKAPPKAPSKMGILKVGIIPILIGQIPETGELRLNYEQVLAPKHSLLVGVSYDFPNFLVAAVSSSGAGHGGGGGGGGGYRGGHGYGGGGNIFGANYTYEGARGMLGYRYYPLKGNEAPTGFYVGPYISYNFANAREKSGGDNQEQVNYFDACAVVGYQLIKKNHFTFDFTGGLGYKDNFITNANPNMHIETNLFNSPAMQHIKLMLQLNFGYAF